MAPIIGMLLREIRSLEELKASKAEALQVLKDAFKNYMEIKTEIIVSQSLIEEMIQCAKDEYFEDDDYDETDMYENLYQLDMSKRTTRKDVLTVYEAIKCGKSSKLHKLKPRKRCTDKTRTKEEKANTRIFRYERQCFKGHIDV